jgi:undecaprenyl diphosphate synthase
MVQSDRDGLHVALIMDGNGRWAARRGLPRIAGHRAGVASVRTIVEHAPALGIRRLTLYAFSSDNWRRPMQEVHSIFWLMRAYLRLETDRLRYRGVRLDVLGRRDRIPAALRRDIERTEAITADGTCVHLRVAVDYSSRDAITQAAARAGAVTRVGNNSAELLRDRLTQELTAQSSEVDLLIRTGGEKRLSDFLLWESAYAELFFTERMWPDFDAPDLEAAVRDFKSRERRFGGLPLVSGSLETITGGAR